MRPAAWLLAGALLAGASPAAPAVESVPNGVFLVAKREMRDPNFRQTVVLVTQPAQGGPFGVIINRPLSYRLNEAFPGHDALKGRADTLYAGGPVARQGLVFLVRTTKPPRRATPVLKDVYFTSDADWIDELLKRPGATRDLRVFAGYAGWAPGQLQHEIERGDWYVLPADAKTVFEADPAAIWPALIARATQKRARSGAAARAPA
jgi:putative transcriptional regulator